MANTVKKCTYCGKIAYIVASQDGIEVCYTCYENSDDKNEVRKYDRINPGIRQESQRLNRKFDELLPSE